MIVESQPLVKQRIVFCSLLVFFMCFIPYNLNGQSISFNLNSISINPFDQEYINDSVEVNYSYFTQYNSTNYDIAYSYSISNTTELFLSVGTLIATGHQYKVDPLEAPFSKGDLTVNDIRKEITARVGFLKNLLEKDRFVLRGGFSLNYANGYKDETERVFEWYDINGIVTHSATTKYKSPNSTNYGLSVLLRNEYFLTKSFSIYFDINYLSSLYTKSGTYITTNSFYDVTEDELITEFTTKKKDTHNYFSQRPFYSIGVSWNFLNKKNNPKGFSRK